MLKVSKPAAVILFIMGGMGAIGYQLGKDVEKQQFLNITKHMSNDELDKFLSVCPDGDMQCFERFDADASAKD